MADGDQGEPVAEDGRVALAFWSGVVKMWDTSVAPVVRSSPAVRVGRWRGRVMLLVQGGLAAGLAWWVATVPLGHTAAFFAPASALLVLGISHSQRTHRARQLAVGVAIGVGVGDLGVHLLGAGAWQLAVITFVAMSIATLVNAGPLITVQAGVQSLIVATLSPGLTQGLDRWIDALVGCVLALVITAVTPTDLVTRPRVLTAGLLDRTTNTLREVRAALAEVDPVRAEAAHATMVGVEVELRGLDDACQEAVSAARSSVARGRALRTVGPYVALPRAMERLVRDLGVLTRRSDIALWRGEAVPSACLQALDDLARAADFMAGELWDGRVPVAARPRLIRIAAESCALPVGASLSSTVVVAQIRSMITDLLMVAGLPLDQARAAIPDMSGEGHAP